jgi:carbonic anhydrase/acetyltransferase-like protein (isoleucine patch superfamily)
MPIYALEGVAPEIAPDAFVAPTAVVIGRVRLLAGASVWWGAVLRGDTEMITIGEGSNIQDNAVCHTDLGTPLVVGRAVTVGHGVILHSCTIGDGALVGMGAVVLNRARLGARALLAAKSLVPEGKSVPDGMLAIGAPAKVARELTAEEIARIAAGAAGYVAKAATYRAHCHPVG